MPTPVIIDFTSFFLISYSKYLEDIGRRQKETTLAFIEFEDFIEHDEVEIKRGYEIFEKLHGLGSLLTIEHIREELFEKGLTDKREQDFIIFFWLQGNKDTIRGSLINLPANIGEALKAILQESEPKLPSDIVFPFVEGHKIFISKKGDVWTWKYSSKIVLIDPTHDEERINFGEFEFEIRVDFSELRKGITKKNASSIVNIDNAFLYLNPGTKYAQKIIDKLQENGGLVVPNNYFTLRKLLERFKKNRLKPVIELIDSTIYRAKVSGDTAWVELPLALPILKPIEDYRNARKVLADCCPLMQDLNPAQYRCINELLRRINTQYYKNLIQIKTAQEVFDSLDEIKMLTTVLEEINAFLNNTSSLVLFKNFAYNIESDRRMKSIVQKMLELASIYETIVEYPILPIHPETPSLMLAYGKARKTMEDCILNIKFHDENYEKTQKAAVKLMTEISIEYDEAIIKMKKGKCVDKKIKLLTEILEDATATLRGDKGTTPEIFESFAGIIQKESSQMKKIANAMIAFSHYISLVVIKILFVSRVRLIEEMEAKKNRALLYNHAYLSESMIQFSGTLSSPSPSLFSRTFTAISRLRPI